MAGRSRSARQYWSSVGASLVCAVAAVIVAVAAADASNARGQGSEGGDGAVRIALVEYELRAAATVARAGAVSLELENVGSRRHNMVLLVDGVEVASPHLRPGDTVVWDVPLSRPGTYAFWCNEYRHLEKGMVGTLTVE